MVERDVVVTLTAALGEAYEILAIGRVAFAALAPVMDLAGATLALHAPDGRPALTVDSVAARSDGEREDYLERGWAGDPLLAALLATRTAQSSDTAIIVPLVEPAGLVGTLRCEMTAPCSRRDERHVTAVAMAVAARLQQLGVTAATLASDDLLTRRQRDTAGLALRGMTTDQIAAALMISRNTVKKHLHEVFDRLSVSNRVQLSRALQITQATSDIPLGITRSGDLVVARRSVAPLGAGVPRRNGSRGSSPSVLSGTVG